ncbi:DUF262 domain-containing protein [Mycolicibacterium vaccae]|uniref:DUF262 domain-containing protein n=1 Tax=Mycolicibacterium vaccae TaxID=1810 RepID=UPI003CF6BDFE
MAAAEDELFEEEVSVEDRTLSDEELADLIDVEPSPARVTFSTQDFSVDGLVKRLNRKSMVVPTFGGHDDLVQVPGFQRGFVWSKVQMDRFIESLLLGYPVPGIFLVKQAEDNRLLILDGQQRLVTLQRFYNRVHAGKEFALQNVGDEFKGLTYDSLDESLQFKLDDSYMQATIVSADGSPEVDDSIFQIFERLNSGGTQLTPHEIRVALYAGPLMASIEALNGEADWRKLFGNKSKRIRDHELIMRILALFSDGEEYSRPLKNFLNKFAQKNRAVEMTKDARGTLFSSACRVINSSVGPRAFRRTEASQINMAQAEAICVAVMEAIEADALPPDLAERITMTLLNDPEFQKHTGRATADKDAVETRLERARAALS